MLIIDIILLILLFGFFIRGWQVGLIRMSAGLIGILAGIFLAGHFYTLLAGWLIQATYFQQHINLANFLAMLIIFLLVNGLIGVGAYFIDRIFHIFSFIPFLKTFNKLAGAILGLIGGAFVFGWLILILSKFPLAAFINHYLKHSQVVPYLTYVSNFIISLWPSAIERIKGVLKI